MVRPPPPWRGTVTSPPSGCSCAPAWPGLVARTTIGDVAVQPAATPARWPACTRRTAPVAEQPTPGRSGCRPPGTARPHSPPGRPILGGGAMQPCRRDPGKIGT